MCNSAKSPLLNNIYQTQTTQSYSNSFQTFQTTDIHHILITCQDLGTVQVKGLVLLVMIGGSATEALLPTNNFGSIIVDSIDHAEARMKSLILCSTT